MPKTAEPGVVELDHGTFAANVVPDVFDARDLEYRAKLQALPKEVDGRKDRFVMTQDGNSCTGHAVAAMVNAVLANQDDATHVSPYMLYALARRYDEFEGEADIGSSLRGALKGWYYHGVLPDSEWPALEMSSTPDLDLDEGVVSLALQRPLGAFYRVSTTSLDDMQSAITELYGIVASAAVHDGWHKPKLVTRTVGGEEQKMNVITRTASSKAIGGHAFCIVGYNDVGFLVQNSWGEQWAGKGFATLPYDDWLESGYDAWVARPGVPSVVSRRVRTKLMSQAGGLVEAPGPDLAVLSKHVVNLGNNGRLSQNGRFTSTKRQIDDLFGHLAHKHAEWGSTPKRILLYAHGGLNSEQTGLDIAQRQLNWWLSNEVYPITFAWQTGGAETLENQLSELVGRKTPAGFGINLTEQVDRLIEKTAKRTLRWMWDEMKENAGHAADALGPDWRDLPDDRLPGGSVVVARLAEYLAEHQDEPIEVHLVGHSAGSIFLTGIIEQLQSAGITVESLTYLAAAIRTDLWLERVLPHLKSRHIKRFTAFGMNAARELDDVCGAGKLAIYHKSLLYLVSRAFERPGEGPDLGEVPLTGMAHFADQEVAGTSFAEAVSEQGGELVWSPSSEPTDLRSDSRTHGGFDDDGPTMTSVLLRILGATTVRPGNEYVAHLQAGTSAAAVTEEPTEIADQPPESVTAEVQDVAAPHPQMPAAARVPEQVTTRTGVRHGSAESDGTGNRVIDALLREGWEMSKPG